MKQSLLLILLGALIPLLALAQGPLPPPGAPGPTMKTLDQLDAKLEKRIPISSLPFTISQSGSYYLTGNLTGASGQNGITINASYVTVDLNGFTLSGIEGSLNGITGTAGNNLRIFNGSVQGWGKNGVDCLLKNNSLFDHLRVANNALAGLACGASCALSDIIAVSNHAAGIQTTQYCILTQCSAGGSAGVGITAKDGSVLTNCTASFNDSGIDLGQDSLAQGCIAYFNSANGINGHDNVTIRGCTANNNSYSGIATNIRASITDCTSIGNFKDGIVFSGDSLIFNNHASKNAGAGFHDLGGASRIDGNVSRENTGTGILANASDTVVRNNSGANGNGAANNQYGPTVGPNWGPVGTANNATSPWANF